jgi:hypothetical protein
MAKCEYAPSAYECGHSDVLFDGFESELECYCLECQEAYSKGWDAGEKELARELKEQALRD